MKVKTAESELYTMDLPVEKRGAPDLDYIEGRVASLKESQGGRIRVMDPVTGKVASLLKPAVELSLDAETGNSESRTNPGVMQSGS